jgi:hypothetical protein
MSTHSNSGMNISLPASGSKSKSSSALCLLLLMSCLAYSSTLKLETVDTFLLGYTRSLVTAVRTSKSGKFLLPFIIESFIFPSAIQKPKDQNIQNYKFACSFVWVWNLVSHIKGRPQSEDVSELGAIWKKKCVVRSFIICTLRQILLEW